MALPSSSQEKRDTLTVSRFGQDIYERCIACALWLCALVSVATTIGIVVVLCGDASAFFREHSLLQFVTGTEWNPITGSEENRAYGVLPLVSATTLVALGGGLLALPIGVGTAIFLSEYAGSRMRDLLKPAVEILAGIPSVVYGYLALIYVSPAVIWFSRIPLIKATLGEANIYNAASACIVVAIMILPIIVSLSDDTLRAVPRSLREAAYALGADKFQVTGFVVLPAAASGIFASVLLALARAVGETMAVTLAAGNKPTFTFNPMRSVQTMTAFIAQISSGDTPPDSPEYKAIFAVGLTLFVYTMSLNLLVQVILRRVRQKYE